VSVLLSKLLRPDPERLSEPWKSLDREKKEYYPQRDQ
jgi:hypothetical protein